MTATQTVAPMSDADRFFDRYQSTQRRLFTSAVWAWESYQNTVADHAAMTARGVPLASMWSVMGRLASALATWEFWANVLAITGPRSSPEASTIDLVEAAAIMGQQWIDRLLNDSWSGRSSDVYANANEATYRAVAASVASRMGPVTDSIRWCEATGLL